MSQESPEIPDHDLIRPIGQGAFGQVWLARNVIGTYRAVKLVERGTVQNTPHFDREFKGIQRFEPVSRLHDGLVDILQVGRAPDDEYFYYIMELGDDLELRQEFSPAHYQPRTLDAEYRKRTRILAPEAALIGAKLAEALGFMHAQGLIHRDIKPSNILFVRGIPKIGDPGLVGMIEASQSMGGTPGYIPPEGPGTPQADIFSLGKLLYVISTAKEPSHYPLLPVDMTTYDDSAQLRSLNSVILRACAYNPKERYASAEDLREDLLEVHAGGSPAETRRRLRLARRIGAVLALLLVLAGGGFYRAARQARLERTRLAQSYSDSAIKLTDRDALGALPFLAAALQADPQNGHRTELTERRISFAWRYSPRLLAQFYFSNTINGLAFAPDNRSVALAIARGEVWRWEFGGPSRPVLQGRHEIGGAPADAESVAFSANGAWLASAGLDGRVRYWDLTGQAAAPQARVLGSPAHAVAFHPQGSIVAAGCTDGRIVLTERAGTRVTALRAGKSAIRCLAYSPGGDRLLAGDEEGWVYELDPGAGLVIRSNKLAWVYGVAYNHDGTQCAAAAGNRGYVNPLAPQPLSRIRHPAMVSSVCFDPHPPPDDERLLTSCFDNTVRIWSCRNEEEVSFPVHTETQPTHAAFSPDGNTFAVATVSGFVRVYGFPPAAELPQRSPACASGDGTRYARVEQATNILVSDAASGRLDTSVSASGARVETVRLDQAGGRLLLRQNPNKELAHFEVWDLSRHRLVSATNMARPVRFEYSPRGDHVAFVQMEALTVWQPERGEMQAYAWSIKRFDEPEVRFSSEGSRLAAAWANAIQVVSTTDGARVAQWSLPHRASTVDLDRTGEIVAVGESPPGLTVSSNYVWKLNPVARISPPLTLADGCFLARFDPSGNWLLLADESKTSILCPSATWQRVPRTMRHLGILTEAVFGRQGRLLATQSGYRTADGIAATQVWDLPSGEPVTPPLRTHTQGMEKLYFLASDRKLLVTTEEGYCAFWNLETLTASPEELEDLARLLSCQQLTATGETTSILSADLDDLWQRLSRAHPEWFAAPAR